jgi:tetratricopeptide (TPR) repeat protein
MEAAQRVLALVGGHNEDAVWAALAAAEAALLDSGEGQTAVYCHVVVEAVAGLERRVGDAGRTRRVFALESAVLRLAAASSPAVSVRDTDRLPSTDWRFFRSAFERVMEQLDARIAQSPPESRQGAMAAVTRLGVMIAGSWLLQDRRGNLDKAIELLVSIVRILERRRDVEHLAMEPRFLLAMVALAESGDKVQALELFQSIAAVMQQCDSRVHVGARLRGAFDYWFAVALFQNGLVGEAAMALKRCVRVNYEPVACLTLAALLHLRELDFREAADELQRAMEIDFAQSASMFDYAVLLGRMGNFEGQLQMLEYFCESSNLSDNTSGSGKKRLRDESLAFESASRPEAAGSTLLDDRRLNDLIPSSLSRTSTRMVHLYIALAAMENGTMRFLRVDSVGSSCLLDV